MCFTKMYFLTKGFPLKGRKIDFLLCSIRPPGKIFTQPHTSLCMHILMVIYWIIKPYIWMHNKVWGCAEILLASFPCATASFKILEFF